MKKLIFTSLLGCILGIAASSWAMESEDDQQKEKRGGTSQQYREPFALTESPKPRKKAYPVVNTANELPAPPFATHNLLTAASNSAFAMVYLATQGITTTPTALEAHTDFNQRRETPDVLDLCELIGDVAPRERALPPRKVEPALDEICMKLNKRGREKTPPKDAKRLKE